MNLLGKTNEFVLKKIYEKNKVQRYIQFIFGCLLVAISYNTFLAPNGIVTGGVGGIAIMLNHTIGIKNSNVIFIGAVILIILSYIFLGKERTKNNILGSFLFPFFVSLTENINSVLRIDTSQLLLTAIFAGLISGFGIGLVLKAGFSSGGTDILEQIISKYCHISMGKAIILVDGAILLSASFIFGINKVMYAMIILYLISYISDKVILGISENKAFYIITSKNKQVKDYILNSLGYGVTEFSAIGGFKKEKQNVLMTVLPTKGYFTLKAGLKEIDEDAFFIITDAYEVFGGEK